MPKGRNRTIELMRRCGHTVFALVIALCCVVCGGKAPVSQEPRQELSRTELSRMGYSIQVGAFSNLDNAVRLSEILENQGLNAYYFVHKTGLYKVRFGDFPSKEDARRQAERTVAAGFIDHYYIVSPDDYASVKHRKYRTGYLRDEIVKTAKRCIGVSYRWGGSSPDKGFDCSGLTMTVYRLNGLNLPRSSRAQYRAGTPVSGGQISRGDLVFFATSGGKRVSHVGVYTGNGKFIHAPKRGKRIRAESLSNPYFRTRYLGARTYLN